MRASGTRLQNDRALGIIGGFGSHVLHPPPPVGPEEIEAETVFSGVDFLEKPRPQSHPLSGIKVALKDGELDALAEILAGAGHAPQTPLAGFGFGFDIVRHKDHHKGSPPEECRVSVEVAAQMACQQQRLAVRKQAKGNALADERMLDLLLLALLPCEQDFLARRGVHDNATSLSLFKAIFMNLAAIDE